MKTVILIFFITLNLYGTTLFDKLVKYNSNTAEDSFQESTEKKIISMLGSWVTDSHILLEFIEENGYYIGIAKSDIYDNTSLFLNGEGILRFKIKNGSIINGRVKYLTASGIKKWKDATFKLKDNTLFDGNTLYRKVSSKKFKIRKKRVNRRTLKLRTQALKQVKSIDWRQRLEGVQTLRKLKDRSTIPQLTPLLFDDNKSVRNETYEFLKMMNDENNISGLSKLLSDAKEVTLAKVKNVDLYGYWSNGDKTFRLFLAKNSSMEATYNGKSEAGLYIDSKKEIAIQFTSGEQVVFNYSIEGDILRLSFPDSDKEIFLKKEK